MSTKECTPILRRIKREDLPAYLKIVYSAINEVVFQNSMPPIPIKVVNFSQHGDNDYYACFTVYKRYRTDSISIWFNSNASFFYSFGDWIISVINTILHEMIHEYCYLNGIQDICFDTQYHYTAFKDAAEKYGLICRIKDEEYGYNSGEIEDADLLCRILDKITLKIQNQRIA